MIENVSYFWPCFAAEFFSKSDKIQVHRAVLHHRLQDHGGGDRRQAEDLRRLPAVRPEERGGDRWDNQPATECARHQQCDGLDAAGGLRLGVAAHARGEQAPESVCDLVFFRNGPGDRAHGGDL